MKITEADEIKVIDTLKGAGGGMRLDELQTATGFTPRVLSSIRRKLAANHLIHTDRGRGPYPTYISLKTEGERQFATDCANITEYLRERNDYIEIGRIQYELGLTEERFKAASTYLLTKNIIIPKYSHFALEVTEAFKHLRRKIRPLAEQTRQN